MARSATPSQATKTPTWTFTARFRTGAFGWRSSKLAIQRLQQAQAEILKVARTDPVRAAEGTVLLAGKLWPALEGIDTSSGSLGTAVIHLVDALVPVVRDAPLPAGQRATLLERLWQAYLDDGVDYLVGFADRWGELCGSEVEAARWADRLLPEVREVWSHRGQDFRSGRGASACLSCLLVAKRYGALLDLLQLRERPRWHDARYGARAIAAQGRVDEAIAYAESMRTWNLDCDSSIAAFCEQALIASGRREEAYRLYALRAHHATTYLNVFRSLARTYPELAPERILDDLVATSPGNEGAWFATAMELGQFNRALELAQRSRTDPRTLLRAARDQVDACPTLAVELALLALVGMARGDAYELDHANVASASRTAIAAAEAAQQIESVRERMAAITSSAIDWVRASIEASLHFWQNGDVARLDRIIDQQRSMAARRPRRHGFRRRR